MYDAPNLRTKMNKRRVKLGLNLNDLNYKMTTSAEYLAITIRHIHKKATIYPLNRCIQHWQEFSTLIYYTVILYVIHFSQCLFYLHILRSQIETFSVGAKKKVANNSFKIKQCIGLQRVMQFHSQIRHMMIKKCLVATCPTFVYLFPKTSATRWKRWPMFPSK